MLKKAVLACFEKVTFNNKLRTLKGTQLTCSLLSVPKEVLYGCGAWLALRMQNPPLAKVVRSFPRIVHCTHTKSVPHFYNLKPTTCRLCAANSLRREGTSMRTLRQKPVLWHSTKPSNPVCLEQWSSCTPQAYCEGHLTCSTFSGIFRIPLHSGGHQGYNVRHFPA